MAILVACQSIPLLCYLFGLLQLSDRCITPAPVLSSRYCYTWIRVGQQALPSGFGWGLGNEVFQVRGLLDRDKTLVAASGGGGVLGDRMVTQGQGVSRTSYLLKVQVETCKVQARMREGDKWIARTFVKYK